MKVKGLLAISAALALTLSGTASAEDLTGHKELLGKDSGKGSGCFLNLVSMTRVDREAKQDRWVKVEANITCDKKWDRAHLSFRVNGATDAKHWGTRDYKIVNLPDGIKAGRTTFVEKMNCNTKQGGTWVNPEGKIGLYSWAEVINGSESFVGSVEDRDTQVHC